MMMNARAGGLDERGLPVLRERDLAGSDPDYYHALYRVARAVNASLDEDEVLQLVARSARAAVGVKGCAIRLRNGAGTFDLVAADGLSEEFLRKGAVTEESAAIAETTASGRATTTHTDDTLALQYPEETRREGIASILTVPLRIAGNPIGILRLYSAEHREFLPWDVDFLLAVADLSALAIRNAHLHREVQRALDELREYSFGPGGVRGGSANAR